MTIDIGRTREEVTGIRFLLLTRAPFSRTGEAFALIIFTRVINRKVNDFFVHPGVDQLNLFTRKGVF